ncbi:hypothetical protein DPV78_006264 [Talaromyces pinophilus]|nr:hypothetical protein DPV78_006264 [Talaromyces pinophilus]
MGFAESMGVDDDLMFDLSHFEALPRRTSNFGISAYSVVKFRKFASSRAINGRGSALERASRIFSPMRSNPGVRIARRIT